MTPLKICPLSVSIPARSPLAAPGEEQKIDLINCLGPACQLWQVSTGGDPNDGDCAFVITAQGASVTAHYMSRMFAAAARDDSGAN